MRILSDECVVPNAGELLPTTGSFRHGFLLTSHDRLVEILGEPNTPESADGKVGPHWTIHTTHGPVCVYQYDTKPIGHFSVAAKNDRAVSDFLAATTGKGLAYLPNDEYYDHRHMRLSW